jgi:hypothetical protein
MHVGRRVKKGSVAPVCICNQYGSGEKFITVERPFDSGPSHLMPSQSFFFPPFIKLPSAKYFPTVLGYPHPQTQNIDLQPMGSGKSNKSQQKN